MSRDQGLEAQVEVEAKEVQSLKKVNFQGLTKAGHDVKEQRKASFSSNVISLDFLFYYVF